MPLRQQNVHYLFGAAPSMPVSASPIAGYYYQVKKGDTPWAISKRAYADTGLATVKNGLMLLNSNAANSNIQKGKKGWESYGIKGLQLNPKYTAGDADAMPGSGKSYPLIWVPPLDGRTPEQMGAGGQGPAGQAGRPGQSGARGPMGPKGDRGPVGPMGPKGDRGQAGPTGPRGPMGPAPGPEQLQSLISDFMEESPASGTVTSSDLAKAVAAFLRENPVAQGPRGPAGPRGPMGPAPGPEQLQSLISDFMERNPATGAAITGPMGPRGPMGPPGPMGPRGPAGIPSTGDSSGAGFDMDTARDFVDARIRTALRHVDLTNDSSAKTAGINQWFGIFASGIVAAAAFGAMQKHNGKRKLPVLRLGRG